MSVNYLRILPIVLLLPLLFISGLKCTPAPVRRAPHNFYVIYQDSRARISTLELSYRTTVVQPSGDFRDTAVRMAFTYRELDTVYDYLLKADYRDLPQEVEPVCYEKSSRVRSGRLIVSTGLEARQFYYLDGCASYLYHSGQALGRAIRYIQRVAGRKAEVAGLGVTAPVVEGRR